MSSSDDIIQYSYPVDINKAVLVASLLVDRAGKGGNISSRKLMKLLYLVERTFLQKFGKPLIGGRYRAMPEGPVQSEVYRIIQPSMLMRIPLPPDAHIWRTHLKTNRTRVVLQDRNTLKPEESLNVDEMGVIADVLHDFIGYTDAELSAYTHTLSEWKVASSRLNKWIALNEVASAIDSSGELAASAFKIYKQQKLHEAMQVANKRYANLLRRLAS